MSYQIVSMFSDRIDVKKYKILITAYSNNSPFYIYYRSIINYGNNVWLPHMSSIVAEAKKLDSTFCAAPTYNKFLNVHVSYYKMINLSSVTTKNNDVLGSYLYSDSFIDLPLDISLFIKSTLHTSRKHYYEYGYVVEELRKSISSYIIDNGEFVHGVSNSGTYYIKCSRLDIKYTITSLPDTRIETTCCVLACCEPDKYKLI